jgi:hypothetical protein
MKYILTLLTLVLFVSCSNNKTEIDCQSEVDILQAKVDSMHDELFIKHVELGRYELSLEHLKEVNLNAGLEFENFMYHETE